MPSLIQGYEYDIFVSYRHNDNRSGWVTEFVNALQEELSATIKEPLTIYFDKNPHDGLLETHSVDKSLESKLKCLIFIPIVSQTYCDTKSFAWQHEFLAFNRMAKEDPFGRDVKLSNGNVASRILPIRIHDLDPQDTKLLEDELGGMLRSVDFTFKSPGVNRPLTPSDKREENTNRAVYRDQVNKVANAVKEIISTIKNPQSAQSTTNHKQPATKSASLRKKTLVVIATLLLIATAYFTYQQLSTNNQQPSLEKSIAVLPFVDMSPEHDQEYFGDGVAEEIINVLAQSEGLKVIARSSSFQFKGKNEDLKKIGETLGVANILEGSIRKSENQLRITVQLIETKDGSHIWSKTFDRSPKDILALQDEIAKEVASAFKLAISTNAHSATYSSVNEAAYNAFLQGRYFFDKTTPAGNQMAMEFFTKSIMLDSNFAPAWVELSITKWRICAGSSNCPDWAEVKRLNNKGLELDPGYAGGHINAALIYRGEYRIKESYEEIQKAYQLDPRNPRALRNYGHILLTIGKDDEALVQCKKAVDLDPVQPSSYRYLGRTYYFTGRFPEALEAYKKAYELSPDIIGFTQAAEYPITIMMTKGPNAALDFLKTELNEVAKLTGSTMANYLKGNTTESDILLKALITKYSDDRAYEIAQAYAFRGENSEAIEWLNKAFDQKESGLLLVDKDPVFKSLLDDSKFKEIVSKLNIPR